MKKIILFGSLILCVLTSGMAQWKKMPGLGKDIGASANGSIWIIGSDKEDHGFGIYKWTGEDWTKVDGSAVAITVDNSGVPWVVNAEGEIYRRKQNAWQKMPGLAKDIAAGPNGSIWIVGADKEEGGYGIYRWSGEDWKKIEGGGIRIAVDKAAKAWLVNENGNIYKREQYSWEKLPGLGKDIAVGADGSVWIVGTDKVDGGYGIYKWTGEDWKKVEGGAVRIAVDKAGKPWVINAENNIYRKD